MPIVFRILASNASKYFKEIEHIMIDNILNITYKSYFIKQFAPNLTKSSLLFKTDFSV